MITTLPYRSFSISKSSSPIPVPSAVIISITCSFFSTLSSLALATLIPLPRSGKIACVLRSRPCLAVPPAESPSTRNTSEKAGSRSEQSANLPGIEAPSSTPFRRMTSRAFRAASRASAACILFRIIFLETDGFSSKYAFNFSLTNP